MDKKTISEYDSKITLDYILNKKESVIFERKGIFKPDGNIGLKPTKVANVIIGMLNANYKELIYLNDIEKLYLNTKERHNHYSNSMGSILVETK